MGLADATVDCDVLCYDPDGKRGRWPARATPVELAE